MNSRLPGDIVIVSANTVPPGFHASRSAIGKTYQYRIHVAPTPCAIRHRQVWHHWRALDVGPMRDGARRIVGRHDFRGFASSAEQRENTIRTVYRCDLSVAGDEIRITVQGDGFLYNMVRNIVGTLVEIGRGRFEPAQVDRALASRDRRDAGLTAPPDGLYLVCVHYDPADLGPANELLKGN